jgi:hypothetical protein
LEGEDVAVFVRGAWKRFSRSFTLHL